MLKKKQSVPQKVTTEKKPVTSTVNETEPVTKRKKVATKPAGTKKKKVQPSVPTEPLVVPIVTASLIKPVPEQETVPAEPKKKPSARKRTPSIKGTKKTKPAKSIPTATPTPTAIDKKTVPETVSIKLKPEIKVTPVETKLPVVTELKEKPVIQPEITVKPEVTLPPTPQTVPVPVEQVIPPPSPPLPPPMRKKMKVNELLTTGELASKLGIKPTELLKKMMGLGVISAINRRLDFETASLVGLEYGYELELQPLYGEEIEPAGEESTRELVTRAPVVTIMGHVDHGKTTLLDAICQTNVADNEFGKITQHIGAYKVSTSHGHIVFLDTPGHEAFTAMRARGAQVTDIVVLVVAADDGVMPQTIEAIDHAKSASVPIIVAINKIDSPNSNVLKIKTDLQRVGLTPEEWGGSTIFVEISARQKINLDRLLEMIGIQAELMELKASTQGTVRGVVIESKLDNRRGPVATVLIQQGTLKIGTAYVAGLTYGKVRALIDDRGHRLISAGPSTPVEILGLNFTPQLGDRFFSVTDEREAKRIAEERYKLRKVESHQPTRRFLLEDLHARMEEEKIKDLRLVLKADVRGSLEALRDSLEKFTHPQIKITVIHAGIGSIKQTDCLLASSADKIIIGYNVSIDPEVTEFARNQGVDIRCYHTIFEAIDEIKAAIEGLLEPQIQVVTVGKATVKKVFPAGKLGTVAGCMVTEGRITRNDKVHIYRDKNLVYTGQVSSLRRFKEDIKQVETGYECGIGVDKFKEFKENDVLEVYTEEKIRQKIS